MAQALGTVGVLTVEFFLTADGRASGQRDRPAAAQLGASDDRGGCHQPVRTAGACLVRLASGLGGLLMPAAMVNLLGDLWDQAGGEPRWDAALRARSRCKASPLRQADAWYGPKNGPLDGARPRPRDRTSPRAGGAPRFDRPPTRAMTHSGRCSRRSTIVSRCNACVLLNPAGSGFWCCCRFPGCSNAARPMISWPNLGAFPRRRRIGWLWLRPLPALLRGLAIGCLALALARPQNGWRQDPYIAGQRGRDRRRSR